MATMLKPKETSRHTYVVQNHGPDVVAPSFGEQIEVTREEWRTLCNASESPRILPPAILNVFAKRK